MAVYTYQDEAARKKAAGIALNHGKPTGVVPPVTAVTAKPTAGLKPVPASQTGINTPKTTQGVIPSMEMFKSSTPIASPLSPVAATPKTTQGVIPSQSNFNAPPPPPIINAATAPAGSTSPALGHGSGGTYGKTPGLGAAYAANKALISTDVGKQSEIERTQSVIAARKAQGLDTSEQEKYLTVNLGFKQGVTPDQSMFGQLTKEQIEAEAKYAMDKERSDLVTAANLQTGAIKNNFEYGQQNLRDTRALEDGNFARTNAPASWDGSTGYRGAMLDRGRQIDDTYLTANLNNELNAIQSDLYNFDKLAPDKQRALINEATRIERDYGLQLGSLTGTINGQRTLAGANQDYAQSADQRDFDYNAGRDNVADERYDDEFDYQVGRDKVADDRYNEEFKYTQGRDKVADQRWEDEFQRIKEQDGISNALAWANNSLAEDDNLRQWTSLDYEQSKDGAEASKYEGLPASQVMSGIKDNYSEPVLDEDGEPTSKTKMTTDKVKREQMFLDVVDSGLNDTETNQVLRLLGLTSTEIDSYTKKYAGN